MPEINALIEAVNQLNQSNEDLAGDVTDLRTEISNLPNKYLPKSEAERRSQAIKKRFRWLLAGGLLVSGVVGVNQYFNHETTCGVRSILVLAQTSSTRNPIPPGLSEEERARVEAQRAAATQFYDRALDRLNVLWPCAGED